MNEVYKIFEKNLEKLPSWNEFKLNFEQTQGINKDLLRLARINIYKNLKIERGKKRVSGIYWFIDQKNRTLYIGKGIDIADRIVIHYKAHLKMGGAKAWIKFFSKVNGIVLIKWIEIGHENKYSGETLRIIIERLLTNRIMIETKGREPLFEVEHPSRK